MKILAISHLFPHQKEPRYGIFVQRQLEAIAKLGEDVTVIAPTVYCPSVMSRFKRWKGYDNNSPLLNSEYLKTMRSFYIRPPGNWYNRWSGLAAYLSMKSIVKKMHEKSRFDIIYATDFFPDCDVAMRLKRLLDVPLVGLAIGIDVNQTAQSSSVMLKHFRRIVNSMDGILVCGEGLKREINALCGRESSCVYGVVDIEKYKPVNNKCDAKKRIGLEEDCRHLLFAGYLDKRKGIYELLESFSRIEK
jgi:teichuronic acid biosynthesis glycosyltransferase TuaC